MSKTSQALMEYYEIVAPILENEEFQKRRQYLHHGDTSVYDHSLEVSIRAYYIARKLGLDYRSAAIGGLLHDFYDRPWQSPRDEKVKFLKQHGFVHAEEAFHNANYYFPMLMNDRIGNSILRHMFPLNKIPPRYLEAWVVSLSDKYVSMEVLKHPKILLSFFRSKEEL